MWSEEGHYSDEILIIQRTDLFPPELAVIWCVIIGAPAVTEGNIYKEVRLGGRERGQSLNIFQYNNGHAQQSFALLSPGLSEERRERNVIMWILLSDDEWATHTLVRRPAENLIMMMSTLLEIFRHLNITLSGPHLLRDWDCLLVNIDTYHVIVALLTYGLLYLYLPSQPIVLILSGY